MAKRDIAILGRVGSRSPKEPRPILWGAGVQATITPIDEEEENRVMREDG
jgi:hypothetical protein